MCGIVGAWRVDSEEINLTDSLNAISHRGPDDRGEYVNRHRGVYLGHTRLAIVDLSPTGHQPMLSSDGRVALTFNGEIYNFRELRMELELSGVTFKSQSDTEVLLELYLLHGKEMLGRLNGIFAFAIYDQRLNELLLARDALGVKPLYIALDQSGFAFSSEIKAIVPLLHEQPDGDSLDLLAVNRYVTFLWCPGEGTPLKSVRKLLPGHAMIVKDAKIEKDWAWYELPLRCTAPKKMSSDTASSLVAGALRTAVHRQLISDVPVGAFLSGGLDSSAVVALARERVPEIRCFTISSLGGRDAGEVDDLPYARRVASHLRVPLDVIDVNASQLAMDLKSMVRQLDEPLADPSPLNVMYISQAARSQGIKVLLSGTGGDDLFTGYRRHLAISHEHWWSWLPKDVRNTLGALSRRVDQRSAFGRRASRLFANAGESADERLVGYFSWIRRSDLTDLFSKRMRNAVADSRAAEPILEFLQSAPSRPTSVNRMLSVEQRFFLPDHNLLYTDKMSMAVGVEVRVPFLDTDLVNLAASIPERYKQHGRTGKWILKKAMEPFLPHDVIYRAKTGFGAPVRRWITNELRELVSDTLCDDALRARGLFEPSAVRKLIADTNSGLVDGAYTILSLLCCELWCEHFLEDNVVVAHKMRRNIDAQELADVASFSQHHQDQVRAQVMYSPKKIQP
jgi:asparagine synthase (glutamine-hydrolysing)